ncbi:MAG: PAS domain-containing protein [Actinomycetota bacterium]
MLGQDEARFEGLLADIDAVIWEYETDAENYAYMSPSCERMLGYPRQRWLDEPFFWRSVIHADDQQRVLDFYHVVEREPGHHRIEYRTVHAQGHELWTRDVVHVVDRGPGRSKLVRGICVDITEQRRATDALADAEARYRSLVEQLPGVVYLWSLERSDYGEGTYISPQIEDLLGFEPSEWLADTRFWERRMHPDDVDRVYQEADAAEARGESYHLDYRMIARDGREVWVRDESYPVGWTPEGRAILWQGVLFDISEARRAETERRTLLVQLVRAQEAERRRLGGDIHDDPIQKMTAVGMRVHALRGRIDDPDLEAILDELAGKVEASVASLRGLLFELRPPALERDGLAEALRQYLEMSNTIDDRIATDLVDELEEEPPIEVRAIAYRIAQEALVNAGKHANATTLRVELRSRDGGFLTRIVDDGAGITPDTDSAAGHGGLATMRERAELAGGWLRLLGAPGEGTRVECWLPLSESDQHPTLSLPAHLGPLGPPPVAQPRSDLPQGLGAGGWR